MQPIRQPPLALHEAHDLDGAAGTGVDDHLEEREGRDLGAAEVVGVVRPRLLLLRPRMSRLVVPVDRVQSVRIRRSLRRTNRTFVGIGIRYHQGTRFDSLIQTRFFFLSNRALQIRTYTSNNAKATSLCNIYIKHKRFKKTLKNSMTEVKSQDKIKFVLYVCECRAKYKNINTYREHLNSDAHKKKLALLDQAAQDEPVKSRASNYSEDGTAEPEEFSPLRCFLCDRKFAVIENCMVHMRKMHGFFIPDVEYLTDPTGLFTYVGLMVTKEFRCLWCSERCRPFQSLEAVRKHIIDKGHCRVHYAELNATEEEDGNLEDFYDYSSSYTDETGRQLVVANNMPLDISLGAGTELVLTHKTDNGVTVKTLGSREYLRYYRQQPRPSPVISRAQKLAAAEASCRLKVMREASKQKLVTMTILRGMAQHSVALMQAKIGAKNKNVKCLRKLSH